MDINQTKLWTAIITPFTKTGKEIDYTSLEKVCRLQSEAGCGILVAGSTGEGLSLNRMERENVLKFVLNLKLPVPVMAGVPSYQFEEALDWMNFCSELPNLSAHLMTTPMYTKPGIKGQSEWFSALLQKSKVPAMLYNIPSRTGVKLHSETLKNIAKEKNLWAIKDSSGQVESIVDFMETGAKVQIYCGDDYLMPAFAAEGACGLVSVLSNVWPKQTLQYVNHCLSGKNLKNKIWWRATKALFSASNPIPAKALLQHLNIIESAQVRLPLFSGDLQSMEPLIKAHGEMQDFHL